MAKPDFLAAVDHRRNRIFVLAKPNLSALKINGMWKYILPLSDLEIENYDLITDLKEASKLVEEARQSLNLTEM